MMMERMLIETAPKNGARILAWSPEYSPKLGVCIVRWGKSEPFGERQTWVTDSEGPGYSSEREDVTHWMPLPNPPASE